VISFDFFGAREVTFFDQNGPKMQFFGHHFLTVHRNQVPIAALYSV
jgi:hypothetical protein